MIMKNYVKSFMGEDGNLQLLYSALLTATFVLTILVLFVLWRRRKPVGNTILLTGLCYSGKTLIYSKLLYSKPVKTCTSMIENVGNITVNNSSLRIVDIPGFERLRGKYFDKYKSSVKGLVYVIDSVHVQNDIRDVAEYLYNLLSDSNIQKNVPVLILCNKQDHTTAKGCTVIRMLLEKEMNLLRTTKINQLEATDASSTNVFLGKRDKNFDFSHLTSQICFAESYAYPQESPNIEKLNEWLRKIT